MQQINIILQGGGTRCAYQMAFLNKILFDGNFKQQYKINNIFGTSFGALVGYFFCINRLDILNNFFMTLNENSLKPHFDLWGYANIIKKLPLIGKWLCKIIDIIWIMKSIINKSLYDQKNEIKKLFDVRLDEIQIKNLENYYCCVYNITKQKIEYINGKHPLLLDYVEASSSLWIVFKPKSIHQLKSECICTETCNCYITKTLYPNRFCDCMIDAHKKNEFMDGGILKPIPYEHNQENFNEKYLILTTKDIDRIANKNFLFNDTGNNLFEYLDNIITFLVEYHQYLNINYINKNWHKNENIYLINYKPKNNSPLVLDSEIIKEYISDGEILANDFLKNTILRIPVN